jgi:hypothetical protein
MRRFFLTRPPPRNPDGDLQKGNNPILTPCLQNNPSAPNFTKVWQHWKKWQAFFENILAPDAPPRRPDLESGLAQGKNAFRCATITRRAPCNPAISAGSIS